MLILRLRWILPLICALLHKWVSIFSTHKYLQRRTGPPVNHCRVVEYVSKNALPYTKESDNVMGR